jgi:hypothetical protein
MKTPKAMSQAVCMPMYLSNFATCRVKVSTWRERSRAYETYREHQIDDIHQTQDDIADLCLVVAVAANQEQTCDDVVGEHLPMILSALFNVDDQDLLQPKAELSQIVELEKTSHGACRES